MLRNVVLSLLMTLVWVDGLHPRLESTGLTLDYFAYLGGKKGDQGTVVAIDPSGSVYVGGTTNSPKFGKAKEPVCSFSSCNKAFLVKLDASGRKFLSSKFPIGRGQIVTGTATDREGAVYICVQENTSMGPPGGFVAKYDQAGRQIYQAELRIRGFSAPEGIAVDASGNAYVTGWMTPEDYQSPTSQEQLTKQLSKYHTTFVNGERSPGPFSVLARERDAFVVELDPSGRIMKKFALGGSGDDAGYAISVNCAGHAYITGSTTSWDFPTVNRIRLPGTETNRRRNSGDTDLFVAKVDMANGKLLFSSAFGGSSMDVGYAIALDDTETVYLAGGTASQDFPTVNPVQGSLAGNSDAFLVKLNGDRSQLVFSTYLGGRFFDVAVSMALDREANVYLTGTTTSPDFPVLNIKGLKDGCRRQENCSDAFIVKLDATDSKIIVKGRFGSQKEEKATGIGIDGSGRVYVVGTSKSRGMGSLRLGLAIPLVIIAGDEIAGAVVGGDDTSDAFLVRFGGLGPSKPDSKEP
jgi:hypothetical protein